MIVLIKPVLFAFIKSTAVKQLIVDLLEGLVSSTENTLDDKAVIVIKQALFPGGKQIQMAKATEKQFNELHNLVTTEFLKRVKSGEASTQDLKAACDWLKINDISGVAYDGNPLDKLNRIMPKVDPELVNRRLYGRV